MANSLLNMFDSEWGTMGIGWAYQQTAWGCLPTMLGICIYNARYNQYGLEMGQPQYMTIQMGTLCQTMAFWDAWWVHWYTRPIPTWSNALCGIGAF